MAMTPVTRSREYEQIEGSELETTEVLKRIPNITS